MRGSSTATLAVGLLVMALMSLVPVDATAAVAADAWTDPVRIDGVPAGRDMGPSIAEHAGHRYVAVAADGRVDLLTDRTGAWRRTTIARGVQRPTEPAIAVDAVGVTSVAFVARHGVWLVTDAGGDPVRTRVHRATGSDFYGNEDRSLSLALTASGEPVLAYEHGRHTFLARREGGSWEIDRVDVGPGEATDPSLAIGAGRIAVAFWHTDLDGEHGSHRLVQLSGGITSRSRIPLPPSGPAEILVDAAGGLHAVAGAWYGRTNASGGWTVEQVSQADWQQTAMTLVGGGRVALVAAVQVRAGTWRLGFRTDASGSWSGRWLTAGHLDRAPAVAADGSRHPQVVFLRGATRPATWLMEQA